MVTGLIIRVAHTTSVRPKGASENPLIFWVGALIRAEDGGKGRPLGALQTSLATVASERRKHAVVKTQIRTSNERNRSDWGRKQAGRCGVSVRDQPCQMLGPYFKALACTISNFFFFFLFPLFPTTGTGAAVATGEATRRHGVSIVYSGPGISGG